MLDEENFENYIVSNNKISLIPIVKEIIKYHELIYIFVKKDFKILYKQTVLGPLLYIIQPPKNIRSKLPRLRCAFASKACYIIIIIIIIIVIIM